MSLQKTGALHFSGISLATADQIRENNVQKNFEFSKIDDIYEKGDAILFENPGLNEVNYLHLDELRSIIGKSVGKLDFVFLDRICEEGVVKIFLDAGTHHIIGVDAKRSNEAILLFTKTFYRQVWQERSKICDCFNNAKKHVENELGQKQANCFVIYKQNYQRKRHKCLVYGNFQEGKPTFHTEKSLLWDAAPAHTDLIGYRD
jgi:hypothetical protein